MQTDRSTGVMLFLALFLLLVIIMVVYFPGIDQLGLYRDDWNNVFNAYTQGAEMLIPHYASDRPADGYLLMVAYKVFGPDPFPYLIACLLCRFLAAVFIFLTLQQIWQEQKVQAFIAAAFFIVYPGFLQQVDGIAYLPHQTAILCIMCSIWLTFVALEKESSIKRTVIIMASVLLAVFEMFLMEYFIALEAFRFCLMLVWQFNKKNGSPFHSLVQTIIRYIPWLVGAMIFFIWRAFIFDATRNGTDISSTIAPLLEHPKYEGLALLAKIIKNTAKISIGAWTVQPYNILNGTDVKAFWPALLSSAFCGLMFLTGLFFLCKKSANTENDLPVWYFDWRVQWLLVGFISTVLVITPMIVAGREITFASSLDRFTYPGSLCAIMFLVGLISMLPICWVRNLILFVMMVTAAMTQTVNKENYISMWQQTRDFWWQLSWRAPDIMEETFVAANPGAFSPEEDYEIFSPLHLIYYPERDHVTLGTEVLNRNTIQNLEMGAVTGRTVRMIFLWKDHSKPLVISKPSAQSCLHVIDGRNPVYSLSEWGSVIEAGPYSDIQRIITDAEGHKPAEEIFGAEPEHGWCWYYQKMSLAQQKEDWQALEELADEVISQGWHAEDRVEWIPFVQGLAYADRIDDARPYGEILKTFDYLRFEACKYYKNAPAAFEKDIPSIEGQKWLESEFCE